MCHIGVGAKNPTRNTPPASAVGPESLAPPRVASLAKPSPFSQDIGVSGKPAVAAKPNAADSGRANVMTADGNSGAGGFLQGIMGLLGGLFGANGSSQSSGIGGMIQGLVGMLGGLFGGGGQQGQQGGGNFLSGIMNLLGGI